MCFLFTEATLWGLEYKCRGILREWATPFEEGCPGIKLFPRGGKESLF